MDNVNNNVAVSRFGAMTCSLSRSITPYFDDGQVTLYHGDFREVLPALNLKVPVIVTDPPYPKEFLPLYEDLAEISAKVLTENGSLFAMAGHSYLPEIYQSMGKHIKYHWTLAYVMPGGQSAHLWQKRVNTFWKPVLWFVNGKYEGKWIGDVTKSTANEKRFHHWGQSTSGMRDLLQRATKEDDTVLDPLAGGGATLRAAKDLGLRTIGIEIDEAHCQTTVERLRQQTLAF